MKRAAAAIALGGFLGWWISPGRATTEPAPCPGADSPGYVLTEVYADGGFRCE